VGSAAMYLQGLMKPSNAFSKVLLLQPHNSSSPLPYRYPKYTKTSDFVYPNAKESKSPRFSLAFRTSRSYAAMRLHHDLDQLRLAFAAKHTDLLVDEAHETLHPIQNGFNLSLNS
jgi:hypothetical protein